MATVGDDGTTTTTTTTETSRARWTWRLWREETHTGVVVESTVDDVASKSATTTTFVARGEDLDSARRRDGGDATGRVGDETTTREAVRTLDFSNVRGDDDDDDDDDVDDDAVVAMTSVSARAAAEEDASARYASESEEEDAREEDAREEDAREEDAPERLRRALDAVDAASREALARNFNVVSVRTLSREVTRAREAAGVEDLRSTDSESESEDAESRAARLELSRARYRAKVAEAEALILRREADEAKKRCVETYGEEGRAWLESLQLRVDAWRDECERRLETLPGRLGRGESTLDASLDAMAKETRVTWLQLQSSATERAGDACM